MTTVAEHVQGLALDARVELFEFDLAIYGGTVYRYVNDVKAGGVYFDGQLYSPLPLKSEGWAITSRGTLPRPTITVSNVTGLFSYFNYLYNDLIGISVTRKRTFAWALDGEPTADPTAILYPIDRYAVAQKTHQDDEICVYELRALMDLQGAVFPGRMMVQNFCNHTYRRWNGSSFDYSKASCPYNGAVYRTRTGDPTTAANDKCGKTLPECLARFGIYQDLPYRGFPGIDRVRF